MALRFRKLKIISEEFFNLLFPPLCVFCRQLPEKENQRRLVCHSCIKKHLLFKTLFCATCGARLPNNEKICHKENQYRLGTPTHYSDPVIRSVIQELKYSKTEAIARALAGLITEYFKQLAIALPDYILIPVPLHSSRLRSRGFNQSELIARYLSEAIGLKLVDSAVKRRIATKPQVDIRDPKARRENVAGCFEVFNPDLVTQRRHTCGTGSSLKKIRR
jgi:predicted amidophosphoribosyltransferase